MVPATPVVEGVTGTVCVYRVLVPCGTIAAQHYFRWAR